MHVVIPRATPDGRVAAMSDVDGYEMRPAHLETTLTVCGTMRSNVSRDESNMQRKKGSFEPSPVNENMWTRAELPHLRTGVDPCLRS